MKIPALVLTSSILLLTTLNTAYADPNPIPFLPPLQHSQSQSQLQPVPLQPQQQYQQPPPEKQPLNSNDGHKNQYDNPSPAVTSMMPF